jgi:hypothetical protein
MSTARSRLIFVAKWIAICLLALLTVRDVSRSLDSLSTLRFYERDIIRLILLFCSFVPIGGIYFDRLHFLSAIILVTGILIRILLAGLHDWQGTVPLVAGLIYFCLPHQRRQSRQPAVAPGTRLSLTDENWHEWLMNSLTSTGVDREEPNRFRYIVLPIITLLGIKGADKIVDLILGDMSKGPDRVVVPYLYLLWALIGLFALSRLYNQSLRSIWQARARSAERELEKNKSRRPVLYLRSFEMDAIVARKSWLEKYLGIIPIATPEQAVTKALRRNCGPVIAIGRPSERLPALGAARFYVSDELWQQKVIDVMRVAELVLLTTGRGRGLEWELGFLLKSLPPEKIAIWAHPHLLPISPAEREIEWQVFQNSLGHLFPRRLPDVLGEARFFYFKDGYEPVGVAPTLGSHGSAMRKLLKERKHYLDTPTARANMAAEPARALEA